MNRFNLAPASLADAEAALHDLSTHPKKDELIHLWRLVFRTCLEAKAFWLAGAE